MAKIDPLDNIKKSKKEKNMNEMKKKHLEFEGYLSDRDLIKINTSEELIISKII